MCVHKVTAIINVMVTYTALHEHSYDSYNTYNVYICPSRYVTYLLKIYKEFSDSHQHDISFMPNLYIYIYGLYIYGYINFRPVSYFLRI